MDSSCCSPRCWSSRPRSLPGRSRRHCGFRWNDCTKRQVVLVCVAADVLSCGGSNRALVRRRGSRDRKSTRLNSSHITISYAVFCLKKKKKKKKKRYTKE